MKRKIIVSIFSLLLAITSVFGLTSLKKVQAVENSAGEGVYIHTVSLRVDNSEADLSGLRFDTKVTKTKLESIFTEADGKKVIFGTEIVDADRENPSENDIMDIHYVEATSITTLALEEDILTYYATVTFNEEVFKKDIEESLLSSNKLTSGQEDYDTVLNNYFEKYKALSYAELLIAKSYYQIEGQDKKYTNPLTTSMRLLANHYDKNENLFNGADVSYEDFKALNEKKNYFKAGGSSNAYLEADDKAKDSNGVSLGYGLQEDGSIIAKIVGADSLNITAIAHNAQNLTYNSETGVVTLPQSLALALGESIALYAFDKDNNVTVLSLKYVTKVISTKEDLTYFNVGYTYDDAVFTALNDNEKVAYLENAQNNPYDYYDGYYVLANNVDATGITFNHEAVVTVEASQKDSVGFEINEDEDTLNFKNSNAQIEHGGVYYNIPHSGYPALKTTYTTRDKSSSVLTPGAYFFKMGLLGTFDGQGYIISNLNTLRSNVSIEGGTADRNDAGIFGAINAGSVIKNVAVKNVKLADYVDGDTTGRHYGSIFALIDISPAAEETPTEKDVIIGNSDAKVVVTVSGTNYTLDVGNRTRFENIYVEAGENTHTKGTLYGYSIGYCNYYNEYYSARGAYLRNVVIDISKVTTVWSSTMNSAIGGTARGYTENYAGTGKACNIAIDVYLAVNKAFTSTQTGAKSRHDDITVATTMEDLYSATANYAGHTKSMATSFINNDYWTVLQNAVYWKGLEVEDVIIIWDENDNYISEIELNHNVQSAIIKLTLGGSEITPTEVNISNENVLKYENGKISILENIVGDYEVEFVYDGKSAILSVKFAGKSAKILAIGNSFSQDATTYLWDIYKNAGYDEVIVGNMYIGSSTLDTHYSNITNDSANYTYQKYVSSDMNETANTSILTALQDEKWDVITIQQGSADSGISTSYTHLSDIITYINNNKTNPKAKIYWHMTWAYQQDSSHADFVNYDNDQLTMYNAIVSAVQENVLNNTNISGIIPSGTTIQNLRTSALGDTLTRDGYHMSLDIGRYATALTYYATINAESIEDISFLPADETYANNVASNMSVIKESVNNAIAYPFEITNCANRVSINWTNGFYNSSSNDYNVLTTEGSTAPKYWATQNFSRDELPIGSIIYIKEGYQYRPEGWIDTATNDSRPENVTTRRVIIDEAWWGNYTIRAFNVTTSPTATDISNIEESELNEIFQIYRPLVYNEHPTQAIDYKLGSISDTGVEEEGANIVYDNFVPLGSISRINVPSGYKAKWFAYDSAKTFLSCGETSNGRLYFDTSTILASSSEAVYVKFYFTKLDGSDSKQIDIYNLKTTFILNVDRLDYVMGTLNGNTGGNASSTKRIRLNNYFNIANLKSASTPNSSYRIGYALYDKDKNFISWHAWSYGTKTRNDFISNASNVYYVRFTISAWSEAELGDINPRDYAEQTFGFKIEFEMNFNVYPQESTAS